MVWKKSSVILLIITLVYSCTLIAQEDNFDKETWKELTEDLNYGDIEEAPEERIQEEQSKPSSGGASWGISLGSTGQFIVISLIVLLLIFLVARLLGFGSGGKLVQLKKEHQFSIESLEEQLHESDLEKFLRLALEQEDFRVALRIYYLMVMKSLSELGWIIWKKDKTNYDYVREMRSQMSYQQFRSLTGAFEIIWYGEIDIHKTEYDQLHPMFKEYVTFLESISEED